MAKKLVGNQSKIDKNKDGKISEVDFKMMGNKKNMKKGGRVAKKLVVELKKWAVGL
jgi:hypothetical protein